MPIIFSIITLLKLLFSNNGKFLLNYDKLNKNPRMNNFHYDVVVCNGKRFTNLASHSVSLGSDDPYFLS